MLTLSNRQVFLFGEKVPEGVRALVIWLKHEPIAGTDQELWDRTTGAVHGTVKIPKATDQIHFDIMLPYVNAVENSA